MQRQRSRSDEKIHIATLDVRNYRPDEVSLRVEGNILVVKAKHYSDGSFGFERNEFQRTYPVPQDADPASITSKISQDGYLTIEATRRVVNTAENDFPLGGFEDTRGEVARIDDKKFSVLLDVTNFAPEEIKVKVVGNELTVSAKHESDTEGHFTSRQFNRHFVLPKDVNMNSVMSRMTEEGKLLVEAERKALPPPQERFISIEKDKMA
ncbi:hypothetical protein OS493_020383 [Desmophyllum pertusum]|uniref:SHSP domain-containing protein n=1 Tax=Desmophyllum pertusum TaxID=174260 RepID=A0A9X0D330_9CNID|nr:hypothetical protein OS493_020383 [Desmophyllum pertusum]